MKKVLLSLVALMGVVCANAQTTADISASDNAIYVEAGVYPVGSEILVPVKIKNAINAQACTFYVTLPDGLNFAADSEDDTSISCEAPNSDHTVMSNINNGMIALYSPKNAYLPETFLALHLSTEGLAPGEYTIKIDRLDISNADNAEELILDDAFVSTIVLGDAGLILDEDAEVFPVTTYTGDVTVKRTLKTGKWNTIVLPFAVTKAEFSEIFGADAAVAQFDSWTAELDETADGYAPANITINFTERKTTLATVLLAGTPYLIKPTKDVSEISKSSVTVALSSRRDVTKTFEEEEYIGAAYDGVFVSTYAKGKVPTDGLFIRDGKFYYSTGETIIKGFRGYFNLNLKLNKDIEAGVKMQILIDGEETSIDNIDFVNTNGAIFTIDGKKMGTDVSRLPKGVYIIDGKKVAIK